MSDAIFDPSDREEDMCVEVISEETEVVSYEATENIVSEENVPVAHTSHLELKEGELASDKVADLVEYIVCGLVTNQDAIALDVTDSHGAALIEISCAEEDAGRIIGRKGRTIKAIRTLARALGSRVNTAVEVEVLG